MSTLIEKATRIAVEAHAGQTRKTEPVPYVVHPVMVAFMLSQHGYGDTVLAAALTHDVLEDTAITEEMLESILGEDVASIVKTLSEDKELLWEERKERYIQNVAEAEEDVWSVSIADKIHNLQNLLASYEQDGEVIWSHFNRGKEKKLWFEEEMLSMFSERWQHELVDEYRVLVEKLRKLVK